MAISKFSQSKKQVRVSVKALIVLDDKLLLVKEKIGNKVIYDFPGGAIEYGETPKETLRRELREELGVEVNIGVVVGAWSFVVEYSQVQAVLIGYQCHLSKSSRIDLSSNPAVDENIFGVEWVDIKQFIKKGETDYHLPTGMVDAAKRLVMN